ncbi:Uncharacterised protein [Enterobacter ludwigii]|nr:Uncharacterised protein [Enterobacter ludwigii]SAH43281.1 Uncharacterised protein [Enterobacter ludwigii]
MAVRQIISRLDSHDGAGHQGPRVNLFGETMRVLMDKQLMSYAMPCPVIVIQPHFPQRTTREGIELMALAAGGKL